MSIKDHGIWKQYLPTTLPEGMPSGVAYLHRLGDGIDWYVYVNTEANNPMHKERTVQFASNTVKAVVEILEGVTVIRAAAVDATRLFPQDCQLVELLDVHRVQDEPTLIAEFAGQIIDLTTGDVGPKFEPTGLEPSMDERVVDALDQILRRLEKLEAR